MIYNMVFQYPRAGIRYLAFTDGRPVTFQTTTRDVSQPFCSVLDLRQRRRERWIISSPNALQLLLANKQVFQEAFTYFYRNNLFFLNHAKAAKDFFRRSPAYRHQHITQLAIDYSPSAYRASWTKIWPQVFTHIAALPNLRKLYIHIDEDVWEGSYAPLRRGDIDVLKVSGMAKLRRVRADEVMFTGNCATIAAHLKDEIEGRGSKKEQPEGGVTIRSTLPRASKRVVSYRG